VAKDNAVGVGLIGFGTIGTGVVKVLRQNADVIERRLGHPLRLIRVADLDLETDRGVDLEGVSFDSDSDALIEDPAVDIVIELIGGYEVAKRMILRSIEAGKHVVTANKALLALHGREIFGAAAAAGLDIAFEAAVGGGIPILRSLREGLAANQIESVLGILNGTTNYVLTEMESTGEDFEVVLKRAQELGYAEADPTIDVEGIDAAHKLAILAAIAFGKPLAFDKVYTEGITGVTQEDLRHAEQLGYRIKHLGIARRTGEGVELRVHPTLIPERCLIANVNGVMNAVLVKADAVGSTLYYGAGAGAEPTASAVVADLVDVVRALTTDPGNRVPHLAFQPDAISNLPMLSIDDAQTAYYLRMLAEDRPGVLAEVATILGDAGISIEALVQPEPPHGASQARLIMLSHRVRERQMNIALEQIEALDSISGKVARIRVEQLDGD